MAELVEISKLSGEPHSSVVFLHGLGGDLHDSWRLGKDDGLFWPSWLADELNDHAVWSVGYEAPVSRWRGTAMHLTSRADNILARLLAEERLQVGRLILMGHSLGGLIIKQLLHTAESEARSRQEAISFLDRVDKVAFFATPHAGAGQARLVDRLRILVRPSAATACLLRNDPHLRDLNLWYRAWAKERGIAHLVLTETKPTSIFGMVVKPDSSDPGLDDARPIPISGDHFDIIKPASRTSDTYVQVLAFILREFTRAQAIVAEAEPLLEPVVAPHDPNRYVLENLPTPHSEELIGRTSEKALLSREWTNRGKRNVLALIAEGGNGKSFLVSRWLAELKNKEPTDYSGAKRIFTWSFYSQGSKGQVTSSEGFFSDLLRSFGENPETYDSLDRADKALELVANETMILVLDGVEPLQNPPGHPDAGRFHDRTLGDFNNRLARQPWPGLIVLTSRQHLAELRAEEGQAVRHVDVETLKPEDGVELLTSLGVTGPEQEKQEAAREMGGHAFGLVLLGHFLVDVTGDPDIYKRDQAKLLYTQVSGAEKAKAMLQAYVDWFGEKSAETAMLHLLGLFDRPVPVAALGALVAQPVIAGLTDAFDGEKAPPLNAVLGRLEKLKLITRPDEEMVDGHPLVREHFGTALEKKSSEAWKKGHARLFDYFCKIPDQDQPDSEAGLLPLYLSLPHGVAAGRAQEALVDVFYQRISRSGQFYATKHLGLYSTELAALAAFFPGGWQTPLQEITPAYQGFLLGQAGFRLRALGRLKEAQTPFEHQINLYIELDNHRGAAANSINLSDILLVRGELQASLERATDAVGFIDKTEDKDWPIAYRAKRANVLAMQGNIQEAKALFEEAEQRQKQVRPHEPYLYSVWGSYYTIFLLRVAAPSALSGLAERVQATLSIDEQKLDSVDIALDKLNLARIAARAGDQIAPAQFDAAIAALRKAGMRDRIPSGYLARAGFRRARDDLDGAWEDLAQTRNIAEPSGMRLHLLDALIEEAWLHHLSGEKEKARPAFEEAEAEVDAMGYHWQGPELAKLRQALD